MNKLIEQVKEWHYARNLINGSTNQDQMLKLMEEAGELAGSISRGLSPIDDIGDCLVVLINIAERDSFDLGLDREFKSNTANPKAATLELSVNIGCMSDGILADLDVSIDAGGAVTCLANLAFNEDLTLKQCLEHSYGNIKDRTGMMVDGVFVKELSVDAQYNQGWEDCKGGIPHKDGKGDHYNNGYSDRYAREQSA